MSYILVIICVLAAIFFYIRYKNFYNPPFLMAVFWAIITFFSTFGLYNQDIADDRTYLVCLIGMIGFFVGSLVNKKITFRPIKIKSTTNDLRQVAIVANNKVITVILVILIVILLQRDIRVMSLLASGVKMNQIRVDFNNIVLNSAFERAFNTYIVMPLIYLLPAIVIPEFIAFRKRIINLILTILVLIEFAVCDGGRAPFYYCAIFVLCSLYIFHIDFKNVITVFRSKSKKTKRLISIVAVGVVAIALYMIVFLSASRDISYSVGNSIYTYFTGCFPFLEYNLNIIDQNNVCTFGSAFFHGILTIVLYLLNALQLCAYPDFYNYVHEWGNIQEFINIGSANFNAFVTPFYYFYMDLGYFGVLLGSAVYGLIAIQIYHRMKSQITYNFKYIAAYMLIVQSIATSMIRWQFYNANFVMAFVLLLLIPAQKEETQRLSKHF